MKRVLLSVLAVGLAGYFCAVGYFYLNQDAFIFPRRVNAVAVPLAAKHPGMEVLSLPVEPGVVLHGLLLPAQEKTSATLVLAFGGNAHDVTGMVAFLKDTVYGPGPVAVAGVSYRGYPNALNQPSGGVPTERNVESDAVALYDNLVARLRPARVVVAGYSLGTAVGTSLAMQRHVDELVLIAPFTSMVDLGEHLHGWLPVRPLLKYPFETETRLKELAVRPVRPRVTIVYSTVDGLIPTEQPKRLAADYPGAKLVALEGLKHGAILDHPELPGILRAK